MNTELRSAGTIDEVAPADGHVGRRPRGRIGVAQAGAPPPVPSGHRPLRSGPRRRRPGRHHARSQDLHRRLLAADRRAVDAGPPLGHRPGPVQLHRDAPPVGQRRVGLRGHPGVAVQGVRRRRLQHHRHRHRVPVPRLHHAVRPCPGRPRRSVGLNLHPAGLRHRRLRHPGPRPVVLAHLAPAGAPAS